MERVGIIGGNTLIGRHLLDIIEAKAITVWDVLECLDFDESFNNNTDDNNNTNVICRYGMDELENVIRDSNMVFNLCETQDFSLLPDEQRLQAANVDFIEQLAEICAAAGAKLVHLSTVYLQSSTRWPNVYGREELDYDKFRGEAPFPAYCDSKQRAEQILKAAADNVPNVCARVGAMYGEGDRRSVVCDAILLSQYFRVLPKVGDQSGTFQMTYAGNVAAALWRCAEKLADPTAGIRHEVVLISDETPIKNIYESVLQPICCSNDISRENSQTSPCPFDFTETYVSFYLFFPIFWMLCLLAWCWAKIFAGRDSIVRKLPSPYYPYMVIHQWTFYSDFKLRIFFGHKPRYNFETSLARSRDYYQQLEPSRVDGFSWNP